jgi:hypothetical protein
LFAAGIIYCPPMSSLAPSDLGSRSAPSPDAAKGPADLKVHRKRRGCHQAASCARRGGAVVAKRWRFQNPLEGRPPFGESGIGHSNNLYDTLLRIRSKVAADRASRLAAGARFGRWNALSRTPRALALLARRPWIRFRRWRAVLGPGGLGLATGLRKRYSARRAGNLKNLRWRARRHDIAPRGPGGHWRAR